jgi:rubredoxin
VVRGAGSWQSCALNARAYAGEGAVTRVNRVTSIQSACGRWSAGCRRLFDISFDCCAIVRLSSAAPARKAPKVAPLCVRARRAREGGTGTRGQGNDAAAAPTRLSHKRGAVGQRNRRASVDKSRALLGVGESVVYMSVPPMFFRRRGMSELTQYRCQNCGHRFEVEVLSPDERLQAEREGRPLSGIYCPECRRSDVRPGWE